MTRHRWMNFRNRQPLLQALMRKQGERQMQQKGLRMQMQELRIMLPVCIGIMLQEDSNSATRVNVDRGRFLYLLHKK